jgi:hypothetical protein
MQTYGQKRECEYFERNGGVLRPAACGVKGVRGAATWGPAINGGNRTAMENSMHIASALIVVVMRVQRNRLLKYQISNNAGGQ